MLDVVFERGEVYLQVVYVGVLYISLIFVEVDIYGLSFRVMYEDGVMCYVGTLLLSVLMCQLTI